MSIHVTGTGQKIEVVSKHGAAIPEIARGEHLWMVVAMFNCCGAACSWPCNSDARPRCPDCRRYCNPQTRVPCQR